MATVLSRSVRRVRPSHAVICGLAVFAVGCGTDGPTGPDGPDGRNGFGEPAGLVFLSQPADAEGNVPLAPVRVAVVDSSGNVVETATDPIGLELDPNPWAVPDVSTGGRLSGTTEVGPVEGIATFDDVRIDRPGQGYGLRASSGALAVARSESFAVGLTLQSVSVGRGHACAMATAGAYCWGWNFDGQLGRQTDDESGDSVAGLVAQSEGFVQVTAGDFHACALTVSGAAYCWGRNSSGQLGDANAGVDAVAPVPVAGGLTFVSISAGGSHTCGVTMSGDAYCWGADGSGQLGNGTMGDSDRPSAVALDTTAGVSWATVSAGGVYSCGVDTTGFGYCWGLNSDGQLGNGTTIDADTPSSLNSTERWTAVHAGGRHTCGLTTDNVAYCWGLNHKGQLGAGSPAALHTSPVAVSGGFTWGSVRAGLFYTCGVTMASEGYCWGEDNYGQLGLGAVDSDRSTPGAIVGGLAFNTISGGYWHSCGLTTGGEAYCWGRHEGLLGNGEAPLDRVPVPTRIVQ